MAAARAQGRTEYGWDDSRRDAEDCGARKARPSSRQHEKKRFAGLDGRLAHCVLGGFFKNRTRFFSVSPRGEIASP